MTPQERAIIEKLRPAVGAQSKLVTTTSRLIGELVGFFLEGWIAQMLWNHILPTLFLNAVSRHTIIIPTLSYWHAVGLVILTSIFFKTDKVRIQE